MPVNNEYKELVEWIISIIVAAVIAILIKGFIFDIIRVSETSMLPNIHDGDRIVVEKISLYNKNIRRGDIYILDPGVEGRGLYIKRIIGLPGEKLQIKDGKVYINGKQLEEDYLAPGTYTEGNFNLIIPQNKVFVLGDNREVSEDSRYFGAIPVKNLKGRAVFRIFPFNNMKKFIK